MTNQHDNFQVRAFALDFVSMQENPTWAHKADRHNLSAPDEASAERLATALLNMATKDNKTIYLTEVWSIGDKPQMLNQFEA